MQFGMPTLIENRTLEDNLIMNAISRRTSALGSSSATIVKSGSETVTRMQTLTTCSARTPSPALRRTARQSSSLRSQRL